MTEQCNREDHFIAALAQIVRRYPRMAAVSEFNGKCLSYEQLWQQSLAVSCALRQAGCVQNQLVAVQIDKSCDFVVAVVGVWLANCALMVLDPQQPKSRLASVCSEAKPDFLLYGNKQKPVYEKACRIAMSDIPQCWIDWDGAVSADNDMAYLLYTSGSSGKPKGVRVAHRGLLSVLQNQIQVFELSPGQNSLWLHSIAFDASISDIGTALLSGSQLCIIPGYTPTSSARLLEYVEQLQINFVDIPPALLQWIDPQLAPACLQTLVVGGEVCPAETLRHWAEYKRVVSVYGPTEATICTSMVVVEPSNWLGNGIGFPMPHVEYRIRSNTDEPVNEGELLIGGRAVALGYLNHSELEKDKFVDVQQQRYYATGDKVRQHEDGSFEFLGRTDRQVKVCGKLVAPEEVETCLLAHKQVRQAAVVPWITGGITRLVAYVELVDDKHNVDLTCYLERRLPSWMVPKKVSFLEKMPLNRHQKVDLGYLTELAQSGAVYIAQTDEVQQLFCQVLGETKLDLDADFFELGGDSISVLALLGLADTKEIPLTAEMLYRYRSVNRINEQLKAQKNVSTGLSSKWLTAQAQNQIAGIRVYDTKSEQRRRGDILLTGATGFFGACLLVELLKQTESSIYCLVRGDIGTSKSRVLAAVARHGLSIDAQDLQRIKLVAGDLQQHQFGWLDEQWLVYSQMVESIYHCAADTSIVKPYDLLKASNVEGTATVMQFAVTGRKKALHYVSTLAVFVDASPKPELCRESDKLELPTCVYGGYAQSKWVAEKMLHLFASNFAQLFIYRLGLLTAKLDGGKAPPQDWFSMILKYGAIADEQASDDLLFDFTPVDFAAKAMAFISINTIEREMTFHINNSKPVSACCLAQAMTPSDNRAMLNDELTMEINRRLKAELKSENVHHSMSFFKRTGTDFEMKNTIQALVPSNIQAVKIDIDYLKQYCKKVLEVD